MNYKPNTIKWQKGDLVLHDSDAKEPKMLMKVVGYTRDGLCKTQYLFKDRKRKIWINRIEVLHDPEQWLHGSQKWSNHRQDILKGYQRDFERVRIWNHIYDIGQAVITTSAAGGFETITTTKARLVDGAAWISLERGGGWSLKFVKAVKLELETL